LVKLNLWEQVSDFRARIIWQAARAIGVFWPPPCAQDARHIAGSAPAYDNRLRSAAPEHPRGQRECQNSAKALKRLATENQNLLDPVSASLPLWVFRIDQAYGQPWTGYVMRCTPKPITQIKAKTSGLVHPNAISLA